MSARVPTGDRDRSGCRDPSAVRNGLGRGVGGSLNGLVEWHERIVDVDVVNTVEQPGGKTTKTFGAEGHHKQHQKNIESTIRKKKLHVWSRHSSPVCMYGGVGVGGDIEQFRFGGHAPLYPSTHQVLYCSAVTSTTTKRDTSAEKNTTRCCYGCGEETRVLTSRRQRKSSAGLAGSSRPSPAASDIELDGGGMRRGDNWRVRNCNKVKKDTPLSLAFPFSSRWEKKKKRSG